MISSLKCIDFKKEYFDEIDESETNRIFTRNEECEHFEVSMRRILSENLKFEKYLVNIECKICQKQFNTTLTKNADSISYFCKNCNNPPQNLLYFNYQNLMATDEESINENQKKRDIKAFSTPQVKEYQTPPSERKIYNTPGKEIVINFIYNDNKNKITLNELEPLESQCTAIKKSLNIEKEKSISIFENSEIVDIKKSPKDLRWMSEMVIEINLDQYI